MRMRRRISESIGLAIIPAVCATATLYFGYFGIMGPRGLIALNQAEADVTVAQSELARVRTEREALQHRITLLDERALDSDLLEEVARSLLLQGHPREVAVPREKH